MKLLYYSILLFTFFGNAQQQPTLDYYLPQNSTYKKVSQPLKAFSILNSGEMHADHTQVALYMKEVAKASNRILIETTGLLLRIDPYNY
jgi:hypothetical protein